MFTSEQIAERIKSVCSKKGVTIGSVLENASLGRNTMANFKTSMPKLDTLAKIADVLDCSLDFLAGRTDVPEIANAPIRMDESEGNVMRLAARNGQSIKIRLTDEQYDTIYKLFCSFPEADDTI